jgi:Ca2+-binding RTX toxin-like protein
VNNVSPTAHVAGPALGVRGQPRLFQFSATDPSPVDQAAGFTYTITWGDGTPTQTIAATPGNGAGLVLDHIFVKAGAYTVQATATDKDGGVSQVASEEVRIARIALEPDPANPGKMMLVAGASNRGERILFTTGTAPGSIRVHMADEWFGPFFPTSRILGYGQAGDDFLAASADVKLPTFFYGAGGNDILFGGGGPAVLVGGAGSNELRGGLGRSILISGSQGSKLVLSLSPSDILIGGTTVFDANDLAMTAIAAEWTSSRGFDARVANLSGDATNPVFGQRLNGDYDLLGQGPNATVFDNGARDFLDGNLNRDWFFAGRTGSSADTLYDRATNAKVTEIFPPPAASATRDAIFAQIAGLLDSELHGKKINEWIWA